MHLKIATNTVDINEHVSEPVEGLKIWREQSVTCTRSFYVAFFPSNSTKIYEGVEAPLSSWFHRPCDKVFLLHAVVVVIVTVVVVVVVVVIVVIRVVVIVVVDVVFGWYSSILAALSSTPLITASMDRMSHTTLDFGDRPRALFMLFMTFGNFLPSQIKAMKVTNTTASQCN